MRKMITFATKNKEIKTMFTTELAERLIGVAKKVLQNNEITDEFEIEQTCPMNIRMKLIPIEESDYSFLWEISQSAKNIFRFSLHVQEDESKTGLLRVDYNGNHRNPETDNGQLPERFKPYIGKRFIKENHVHYHIEGYNSLVWALPIKDVPEISTQHITEDNPKADFAKIINLKTRIIINAQIL